MRTSFKVALVITFAFCFNFRLFAQQENNVVVAADNMNVFYIGIDNPVSIAVPGITNDKLKISIANGTLHNNNGKYSVTVNNINDVVINVAAELKPGEIKMMGSKTFHVKRVPDPIACLNGNWSTGSTISKSELLIKADVTAYMDLPFDLKFEVVSFVLTYNTEEGNLNSEAFQGNKFNKKMTDAIKTMKKGNKIYIEDIKVKCPDETVRNIESIYFVLSD